MRLPIAVNTAFAIAGRIGGKGGFAKAGWWIAGFDPMHFDGRRLRHFHQRMLVDNLTADVFGDLGFIHFDFLAGIDGDFGDFSTEATMAIIKAEVSFGNWRLPQPDFSTAARDKDQSNLHARK